MINIAVKKLISYALEKGLIKENDVNYTVNRLLEVLCISEYSEPSETYKNVDLEETLKEFTDFASENKLTEDSTLHKDLFDTKIMGCLVPFPHEIIDYFNKLYADSPKSATDWYYKFCQNTDYIRTYRINKDKCWSAHTEYGELDLSVNLSKPEKDPKAIADAKNAKSFAYPQCMLCPENEGYAGRLNHPARQNHRIIPVNINNEEWYLQYSPYVYYREHCIVFNKKHIPMIIEKETFEKLFDFVDLFPHYFVGSNADLPIVGGSILSHDHFQGGYLYRTSGLFEEASEMAVKSDRSNLQFPMARASVENYFKVSGFEDVETGTLKWPLSVIRLRHADRKIVAEFADYILKKWRLYTDETVQIYAQTGGEPHNTITPIARKINDIYELDLVLRNNLRTKEHPLGLFHPHEEYHHIKKENIGLIEVMGLAILPSRLEKELKTAGELILSGTDLRKNELTQKHANWVSAFLNKYTDINEKNITEILEYEVGQVFAKVLENSGVFKRNHKGSEAFQRFMKTL